MSDLRIAKGFSLPLDLVTEATAIVATRGAGKSSASAVIVEEGFASGVQAVVFDRTGVYWGLRSNAKGDGPGLPVYVLGGPHGDAPLEPAAGVLIADLAVDSGHSFVLDLSDFSKGQAVKFAADFLERLYDRKARSRSTLLLVMDEAHFYAPQTPRGGFKGDSARLMGTMEDNVGLGRSRGIGVVLTTQRTQALNKAVLDLIETLLVMRMLSPRARAAVRDWIQEKHEDDERGVIASLDSLPTGTAWVWSPLRGILEKVALRRIKTFDSYETPKPGQVKAEPTQRAELDLDALGEQIRSTIERQKQTDPKVLQARIRELERSETQRLSRIAELEGELADEFERSAQPVEVRVEVPVPVVDEAKLAALAGMGNDLHNTLEDVTALAAEIRASMTKGAADAETQRSVREMRPPDRAPDRRNGAAAQPARAARGHAGRGEVVVRQDGAVSGGGDEAGGDVKLNRKAERMVLSVLAQFPQGRTISQTAILTGYSSKGGGFRGALSKLRTAGYIEGSNVLTITQAGLAAIDGQYDPLPTGPALLQHWLGQMKRAAERSVLEVVYKAWPDSLTLAEVAERAGYEVAGGGFRGAVSKLRTLELIEGRGELRVAETLRE